MKQRIEHDSLGNIKVPANKYWGAQTQRSLINFNIGQEKIPYEIIKALAIIKLAAAKTNVVCKKLNNNNGAIIAKTAEEIISGRLDGNFPLSIWQTGSGTQTNMNVNEVIANRCNAVLKTKTIHPNDHVNMSQSSNDVFPSAISIAGCLSIQHSLLPSIQHLIEALKTLEKKNATVIKVGRTHLQDATPISLSQEISGWRSMLEQSLANVKQRLINFAELPLGGTAVGTGINAPKDFDKKIVKIISDFTKFPFKNINNKFRGLASKDNVVSIHGEIKTLATSLYKIANDVRFLSSGPVCGLGELIIPANEPGSSIMPGKINPTQCESLMMITTQVISNDVAISFSAMQGNFELNTFMPLIAFDLLQSINLLSQGINNFTNRCVVGIKPNLTRINQNLEQSLMNVTALTPKIGYEKAAQIAQYAYKKQISLKKAAIDLGFVTAKEFDQLVVFKKMI